MFAKDNSMDKNKYLLENFDRALNEEWVEVYYQPIIRTSNGCVCAEEALVRWDDPIMGVMNPGEFIAILEAVNVIHKLDLFVLEHVLVKMKEQMDMGLYVVPTSINLSQIDFYSCNIVVEINKRVEATEIPKSKIALGISEMSIARTNEQVISAIIELKAAGYEIWLDDYGSGFVSPVTLQQLQFDMLKINFRLVNQIANNEGARVVITELVRFAMSLGMEATAEGVEDKEQVDFLEEIGCSKMQGFYYCRPIPKEKVFDRYRSGKQIGFENPDESDYFSTVGKVSLYDMSFMKSEEDNMDDYFDTLPMAIVEVGNNKLRIIRDNRNFRKFLQVNDELFMSRNTLEYEFDEEAHGIGYYAMNAIRQCGQDGEKRVIDDRTRDGKTVQLLLHRIAVNNVTRVSAVAVVVLSITKDQATADTLTYNYIARALSEDYIQLFYIDLDNGDYVLYKSDGVHRDVSVNNHGKDFFGRSKERALSDIYSEDKELFLTSCSKENIEKHLNEHGTFSVTYRAMINNKPTYVSLKAVKVRAEDNHIIIGISNVDAQMRQREALDRMKEERITYSRIAALSGDFVCIYTVNPESNHYKLYKTTFDYQNLQLDGEGEDFFADATENSKSVIYEDDLNDFFENFTKENVLKQIEYLGYYIYTYRLCLNGKPTYVSLKAALVEEVDGPQLVFGVINVDEQVRKDIEYETNLLRFENEATKDGLTGVKNKRAYVNVEEQLNELIKGQRAPEFALVMCDINGLKKVNDTLGHKAGDAFIIDGCHIICEAFPHSPVYRIGGDEFLVLVKGKDYETIESRIGAIEKTNKKNKKNDGVTIAVGAAKYTEEDHFVSDVFERADSIMYENKKKMKMAVQ